MVCHVQLVPGTLGVRVGPREPSTASEAMQRRGLRKAWKNRHSRADRDALWTPSPPGPPSRDRVNAERGNRQEGRGGEVGEEHVNEVVEKVIRAEVVGCSATNNRRGRFALTASQRQSPLVPALRSLERDS